MKRQRDIIKELSDYQLTKQLQLSQWLLVILAILLSLFFFNDFYSDWFKLFQLNMHEIVQLGVFSALLVSAIDGVLTYLLPKHCYDDGGVNRRIFANRSVLGIAMLVLLVAISEELLFRGVLQTTFGYIWASIIFALVHVRYLQKPVLFVSVVVVSFYLGYLFMITDNLYVTMMAHFIIDFISGLGIRIQNKKVVRE